MIAHDSGDRRALLATGAPHVGREYCGIQPEVLCGFDSRQREQAWISKLEKLFTPGYRRCGTDRSHFACHGGCEPRWDGIADLPEAVPLRLVESIPVRE